MKKGFTLVELLAVIVILAIIAIITIPMISNVIEKSKLGAMEDSAYGLIEAANYYYAEHMNEMSSNKLFVIENGIGTSEEKLNYKGKIEGNAKVLLASNGKVALCLTNGKSYVKKEITDTKVVMNTVSSDTTCEINGIDSDSDITINISGSNSSYYNKNEIDDKLNDIRTDLSDLSSIVSSNKAAIDNLNSSLNESGDCIQILKPQEITQVETSYTVTDISKFKNLFFKATLGKNNENGLAHLYIPYKVFRVGGIYSLCFENYDNNGFSFQIRVIYESDTSIKAYIDTSTAPSDFPNMLSLYGVK